jgi:hypothetical protein
MKRYLLLALAVFLSVNPNYAQIQAVNFDVVNNTINNNNPLPAEELFFITGTIPTDIELVRLDLNRNRKNSSPESYLWKKAFDFPVENYELLISNELRSNDNYDLTFSYYSRATEEQIETVRTYIKQNLVSYLRANLEVTGSGIKTYQSDAAVMRQMDQIVLDGLEDYRHYLGRDFKGFSEIVRQKLEQKDRLKLRRAKFNVLGRKREDNDKAAYANQYINELIEVISNETDQFLNKSLMTLADIRTLSNYPTEKKPNTLPLNFGYGAIAMRRDFTSTQYLQSPYVGFSLPLGNKVFQKFLGNASFSTGVFLQNFEVNPSETVSGPLINRPIYAALGYQVFRIFRINAGAVLVNYENGGTNVNYVQPFVGASLELNLWLGLRDRRR